jgi:hypothetical protein
MAKGLLAIIGAPKPKEEDDDDTKREDDGAKQKAIKAFAAAMRTQDWESAAKALDLYLSL